MARIRTIKPEFFQDEDLATVSELANLLAVGLLGHADDEGYFRANPALVKSVVFPLREPSVSIHDMLSELSDIGFIKLFKGSDGKDYGLVCNFVKHQRVNRATPSKIKELVTLTECSVSPQKQLTDDSSPERKGKEGKGKEGKGKDNNVELVFEHWRTEMKHPQAKLDDKRRRVIGRALAAGYNVEQLRLAIDGCKRTPWNMGDNPGNTVYDSIELIMRDADHVDRFIRNYHSPPPEQSSRRVAGNQSAADAAGELINDES